MCCSIVDGGIVVEGPKVLHDVDFAARWPADRTDVLAQHPERGPDPLAKGKLDSGLNPAVLPAQIGRMRRCARTAGLKARRRVVAGRIADRADDKVAFAVLKDIVR